MPIMAKPSGRVSRSQPDDSRDGTPYNTRGTSERVTSSHSTKSFYGPSSSSHTAKRAQPAPRTTKASSSSHTGDMGIRRRTSKAVSAAKAGRGRVASTSASTSTSIKPKAKGETNWNEQEVYRQVTSLPSPQITPTKKRERRPSAKVVEMQDRSRGRKHARSEESDEDRDEVERILRGKAQGTAKKSKSRPATPDATPEKEASVMVRSAKRQGRSCGKPIKLPLDDDGDERDSEDDSGDEAKEDAAPSTDTSDDQSDDEIDMLGTHPSQSSNTSPSISSTPSKNKSAPSSSLVTPTTNRTSSLPTPRSSARVAGLPIERSVLKKAPRELVARLVGSHMEDLSSDSEEEEEDDSDEDSDNDGEGEVDARVQERELDEDEAGMGRMFTAKEKGKGRAVTAGASGLVEEDRPHSTLYSSATYSSFLNVLGRNIIEGVRDPLQQSSDGGDQEGYLEGYEVWEKSVRYAMRSVVEKDVGNCLILLGQRGVGKTLIVDRAISLLQNEHEDDFILVRINGLVETTDRLALRSIARQLREGGLGGVFDDEDEETGSWGSNASTMSTLLKMLEPSSNTSPSSPKKSKSRKPPSKKSIIMIVDEFDLFALHPRQAFLYSLLDIVQGNRRGAGMGVFGISSRTDCLSILEKRVRSRCQSQVHQVVLPNSLDDYNTLIKNFLHISPTALGSTREEGEGEDREEERARFVEEWREEVEAWLEDAPVKIYFDRLWKVYGCNPAKLREVLSHMFYRLEADSKGLEEVTVPRLSLKLVPEVPTARYQTELLRHLSILELTVCIAAVNTLATGISQSFTTEMLWATYAAFARPTSSAQKPTLRTYSKEEFCIAIDSLRSQELFLPTTGKAARYIPPSYKQNYKHFRFAIWEMESVRKVVAERKDVMEDLRRWSRNLDMRVGE